VTRASSRRSEGSLQTGRALFIVLALSSCTRRDADVMPRVKQALAEREKKLSSYRFSAVATQGFATARHAFAFRAPNKMHGVLMEPDRFEWAFDGTTLFQAKPREKKLLLYQLKLPAAKASAFLHQTFAPFVFEGFRTPLLPSNATAKEVTSERGPAVEISSTLDDDGSAVEVKYLLKWPSGDFISKTSVAGKTMSELHVDEEQCDEKLALCVPKKVTQRANGKLVGSTTLSDITLLADLPASDFSLKADDGWTTETHEVVETGAP